MKEILKDIFIYCMFIWVIFIVVYTEVDSNTYKYQLQLKNLLNIADTSSGGPYSFANLKDTKDVWQWLQQAFIKKAFHSHTWYNHPNATPTKMNNYLSDLASYVIGKVIIRQLRVKPDNCQTTKINGNTSCFFDYSVLSDDWSNYSLSWMSYNSSLLPSTNQQRIYQAFQYADSSTLNSLPFIGLYSTYLGGGYVYSFDTKTNFTRFQLIRDLVKLQKLGWLDKRTRAVFLQFSLYNPNVNLFLYSIILFEFLSTGTILKSFRFDSFSLYDSPGLSSISLACRIIYMFIILFFMVKQTRHILVKGISKCLREFWFYIDWLLIIFSWVSFAMFLYRLYARNNFAEKLNLAHLDQEYINLQTLCYWNELLVIMLGICMFISILKLLKLISFSRNVQFIINTFKMSFKEMFNFTVLSLLVWFAFVNLMYVYFTDYEYNFRTFIKTIQTTFLILIGKFNVSNYLNNNLALAPFIFVFYNIFIVLIR